MQQSTNEFWHGLREIHCYMYNKIVLNSHNEIN